MKGLSGLDPKVTGGFMRIFHLAAGGVRTSTEGQRRHRVSLAS